MPEFGDPPSQERLRVYAKEHGPVVVVHAVGEVDQATADLLHERLLAAVSQRSPPHLVLDLRRVTRWETGGLKALLAAWNAARGRGGHLIVARAPRHCRLLLQRTCLDQCIPLSPTLRHAMDALQRFTAE